MTSAILLCAGKSTRFSGGTQNKTLYLLKGKPLFMYSVSIFEECGIDKVMVVVQEGEKEDFRKFISTFGNVELVIGGKRRQDSVTNALNHFNDDEKVLVHDGASQLIGKELVKMVLSKIQPQTCVVPVISSEDALREKKCGKLVSIDRTKVFRMQTPQGCVAGELKKLYRKFSDTYFYDDAAAFEMAKLDLCVVNGDKKNVKVTTGEDVVLMNFFLSQSQNGGEGI